MDLNERSRSEFVFECLVSLTLLNGMPLPAVCAAIFCELCELCEEENQVQLLWNRDCFYKFLISARECLAQ